jgi:hypothetical protein
VGVRFECVPWVIREKEASCSVWRGGHTFHTNVTRERRAATRMVAHQPNLLLSGSAAERTANALTTRVDAPMNESLHSRRTERAREPVPPKNAIGTVRQWMAERESGSVASESFGRRGQKCGLSDSRTENQTVPRAVGPLQTENQRRSEERV